ncbi:MAG: hypothetical protein ACK559_10785, partial [bacterium]
MAGLEHHARLRRLAAREALVGALDSVVDGVAHDVVERRLQPGEDVAVHGDVAPDDLERDVLAELAGDVAHHPREARHALAERAHAAADDLVVERGGHLLGAPEEPLELEDPLAEGCLGARHGIAGRRDA